MSRTVLRRLERLEAKTLGRDGVVHVIAARSDEDFEEKRTEFICEHGAHPQDIFVHIRRFSDEPSFSTRMTMPDLLAHVAENGRRVHDERGVR